MKKEKTTIKYTGHLWDLGDEKRRWINKHRHEIEGEDSWYELLLYRDEESRIIKNMRQRERYHKAKGKTWDEVYRSMIVR